MNGTSPFPILRVFGSYSFFSNFDRKSVVKREESGQRTRYVMPDLGLHNKANPDLASAMYLNKKSSLD